MRRSVIIRITDVEGQMGWGEAAPYPGHTRDTIDDAWQLLETEAVRVIAGEEPILIAGSASTAGLNAAITDLAARAGDVPLAIHLGGDLEPVPAGVAIGRSGSTADLVGSIAAVVEEGYPHVKIKADRDVLPRLAHVRRTFPELAVAIDANGALTEADLPSLVALNDLNLSYIEQPFAPDADDALFRRLSDATTSRVCLDESITELADIPRIARAEMATAVSLKPGRLGPSLTLRALGLARRHAIDVKIGGLIETGIGRTMLVALSTHPDVTLPSDLAASDRFFTDDLVTPHHLLEDGHLIPAPLRRADVATIERFSRRHVSVTG